MPRKTTTTDSLGRTRSITRASWGMVRTLPSGRLQASFIGPDKVRHTAPATFTTKEDAENWLTTQRAKIIAGEWQPAAVTAAHDRQATRAQTLGKYAAEWINTRTNRNGVALRMTTRTEYERLLRGPLSPLTDTPLAALTPAAVRAWYARLIDTGKLTQAGRAYGLLKAIMATAVADRIIDFSPCQIKGAQRASTGRKITPPTTAELAIIETNMPENLRAMVAVAAWAALRFGELTELRRKDITEDGDIVLITVERAVTRVAGKQPVIGQPKSAAGERTVALPPAISQQLLDHIARFAEPGDDGLIFPGPGGGHYPKGSLSWPWRRARAAAGRDDLPWHGLRHYGMTRYAQTGATLREIQERAGHSTVAAAMKYQHATGRDAELARRM